MSLFTVRGALSGGSCEWDFLRFHMKSIAQLVTRINLYDEKWSNRTIGSLASSWTCRHPSAHHREACLFVLANLMNLVSTRLVHATIDHVQSAPWGIVLAKHSQVDSAHLEHDSNYL